MAALIGALRVDLGMNSAAFQKGADEAQRRVRAMQKQFDAMGTRLQTLGTRLSVGVTLPLVALATKSVQASKRQEQAIAAVEAALGSMGDRAGFTSQQLQDMASELQKNSLFGDEEILERVTANLLTFGNVSGDVFERAQQAALDLSARLGSDLQSSTIQLGKALNDPVKGVSALTEVGVSFTEAQKEQIKALTEANDIFGAQTIILDELEKQYAGQAAALANTDSGKITQAANRIGDAMEKIGAVLLPVIADIAEKVGDLADRFSNLSPQTQKFVVVAGALAAALGPVAIGFGVVVSSIGALLPVLALISAPVLAVVAAVGALGAAAYLLYQNWDEIVAKVGEIGDRLAEFGRLAVKAHLDALEKIVDGAREVFERMRAAIVDAVTGIAADMKGFAGDIVAGLTNGIKSKISEVKESAKSLGTGLMDSFKGIVGIQSPSKVFRGYGEDLVAGLVIGIEGSASEAISTARRLGEEIGRSASQAINGATTGLVDNIAKGDLAGGVNDFFRDVRDAGSFAFSDLILGSFKKGGAGIGGIISGLGGSLSSAASSLGSVLSGGGLSALGAAASAALPVIGAITSAVGLLKGFSSKKITGAGIELGVKAGGLVRGAEFTEIERKRFWGLSKSNSRNKTDFDKDMRDALQARFDGIRKTVGDVFGELGKDVSEAALKSVTLAVERIDTRKLSQDEIDAEINKIFEAYSDALARSVAGIGLNNAIRLLSVRDALAPIGQALSGSLIRQATEARRISELFGGADGLSRQTASFIDTIYSETEKLDLLESQVASVFDRLNLKVPDTVAAFKKLVESQDLMRAKGREAFKALLDIAPAFAAVQESVESLAESAAARFSAFDLSSKDFLTDFDARMAQVAQARGYDATLDTFTNAAGTDTGRLGALVDSNAEVARLMRRQVEYFERWDVFGIGGAN